MADAASDIVPPLPHAEVEHSIPGRMRLRVRGKRGDAGFFQQAESGLAGVAGVHAVHANPHTGSILVEHGGDQAAVLAAAKEQRLFSADPPSQATSQSAPRFRRLRGAPPAAPPLQIAAIGLAGAGLLQLARGQVVGSASENLWNAYGLFAATRQALPSAVLIAFGTLQIARGQVLGSATSLFFYAYSAWRMARNRAVEDTI